MRDPGSIFPRTAPLSGLPISWFEAQSQLVLLFSTIASLAVVAKGAAVLVEGAAGAPEPHEFRLVEFG